MKISFNLNPNKALQTLLWILHQRESVNMYNIMKIVFAADEYHLNKYGRPIYGDEYKARPYGIVPEFMYKLTKIEKNVPFFFCDEYNIKTNSSVDVDMDVFSKSDIEALEHGMTEYADLTFEKVKEKNHQHLAWRKHENEINAGIIKCDIDYEDIITNQEVLEDLKELGNFAEKMVF